MVGAFLSIIPSALLQLQLRGGAVSTQSQRAKITKFKHVSLVIID